MDSIQVERIYDELLSLSIELEPDPTVLGPRYLNEVISRCRNYLNRATMLLLQLQRQKRELSRSVAGEEAIFRIESDRLLSENEQVKRLPNIKDREAFVNVLLTERVGRINQLKHDVLDIETVEKAVRLRHNELVRTSDNIKTQRSLLLADRSTGAGYGDEADGAPRDAKGRSLPVEPDIDENELDRIMGGEEGRGTKSDLDSGTPVVVETPVAAEAPAASVAAEAHVEAAVVVDVPPEPVVATPEPGETHSEPEPTHPPVSESVAVVPVSADPLPVGDDSDITRFLGDEPKKVNGKSQSTNGKKKDIKPEPQSEVKSVSGSKPAGEDDDPDYDFSDLLKNL